MSHAASAQSIPIVTAYDSLGEEGLRHSLKQTGSLAIFLDPNLIPTLAKVIKDAPSLKYVIYNDDPEIKDADLKKLQEAQPELEIISINELFKRGKENLCIRDEEG